ncbi:MAG: hypothetical protein RL563_2663 [Pseudomonadota bacterium]
MDAAVKELDTIDDLLLKQVINAELKAIKRAFYRVSLPAIAITVFITLGAWLWLVRSFKT